VNGKEDDAKKERRLAGNREGFDKLELRLVVEVEISRSSSATRTVLEKWSWLQRDRHPIFPKPYERPRARVTCQEAPCDTVEMASAGVGDVRRCERLAPNGVGVCRWRP
jgi:hypothetical protein